MKQKVFQNSGKLKRARVKRALRSLSKGEAKEGVPCAKQKGQYYVPESSSGFYSPHHIKDGSAILDLHESWYEREPLPNTRKGKSSNKQADDDEQEYGIEVKRYGNLEIKEISDESWITGKLPDNPNKRKYQGLEELVCGFGKHLIKEDESPIQIRTGKGKSYVCQDCVDFVPRQMFMKKLTVTVKDLLGEVKQRSMLSIGYVPPKYAGLTSLIERLEPVLSPMKNMATGFAVGPYYSLAFCSALSRSEKGIDRYTGLYGFGKVMGGLAAAAGVVTCVAATFQGLPEAFGFLVCTNVLSAGYEATRTERFDPMTVEEPYKNFRDFLFSEGYDVARRPHTNNFPYGIVVSLDDANQSDAVKLQLTELASAYKVKTSFNLPETSKGKPILSIGLTSLIKRRY
ncbi:hypothetical protein J4219_07415 [Candidatus Woesearchaeota archaeon]|nr:hypothetical protein [Candidatus Woesearchaeota archaeon]